MSYDTVATISQVTSLLMFVSMFLAVVAYVFWPGNKRHFDTAQQRALDIEAGRADATDRANGGRT